VRRASHSEREKFVALIQQHAGGQTETRYSFAQRLMRYGATYGRLQEDQCNGPEYTGKPELDAQRQRMWQTYQDAIPAKEEKIVKAVSALCTEYGCKPVFSGDPRGNTLKIEVPDGFTNDWGREGICVPTS
jgi:hypothetical protein